MKTKRDKQLGMPFGTASARLKKRIMFDLICRLNENNCFKCGEKIEHELDLSIEHKQVWLDISPDLFWDLDNIAFSHIRCNKPERFPRRKLSHGIRSAYEIRKCRCDKCKLWKKNKNKKDVESRKKRSS